jgi:CRISPR system Cascade subunit CasE
MTCLHMIELRPDRTALVRFLGNQGLLGRGEQFDLGYGVHAWLKAAFGESTPNPFRIFVGRDYSLRVLGYSMADAAVLKEHLITFAEPSAHQVCGPEAIISRPMPSCWTPGRRLGFEVLCCPVIRRGRTEKDAFLASADRQPKTLNRASVYSVWFRERLSEAAEVVEWRLAGFRLQHQLRRTQPQQSKRQNRWTLRPHALLAGTLVVQDGAVFQRLLTKGIGRHRAFGYGMVLLRPLS